MPSFDHSDDFKKALEVAARDFPEQDLARARQERSGYDGNTIWLRDGEGNIIVSFNSEEFGKQVGKASFESIETTIRSSMLKPSAHSDVRGSMNAQPLYKEPISSQTARSLLGVVYGVTTAFCWIIVILGLVLAVAATLKGDGLGMLIGLVFMPVFAALSYFATKLMYVGLEMLADITSDIRAMRERSQPHVE